MAGCNFCTQDMLEADGCVVTHVDIGGEMFELVKYGDEPDDWGADSGERCHDCNTMPGHAHHPGCDVERCPKCERQLISCDCPIRGTYIHVGEMTRIGPELMQQLMDAQSPQAGLLAAFEEQAAAAPQAVATAVRTVKMRNYRQMGTEKLRGCVAELRAMSGDAYERCVAKGGDPAEDLKVATAELAKR